MDDLIIPKKKKKGGQTHFDYEVETLQLFICLVDEAKLFCFLIGRFLTTLPSLRAQGDGPHQTGPHHRPAAAPAEPDTTKINTSCEDQSIF